MDRKYSFPPVADSDSRILILGSLPGEESLRQQQYYANPRNQFWKIIFTLFHPGDSAGVEQDKSYTEKLAFLLSHRIALWDVIANGRRQGSLDTNIRDEQSNDFATFFHDHPQIHTVFFNGVKARDTFRKKVAVPASPIRFFLLPSTSPAHTMPWETKLQQWQAVCAARPAD
ncbi:MAG TPA: DNA-deoxyinosine glycosylase [Patescibacteria group bacterium]|nr:DNA-deoxyinosine glycosylase [Patescibacteria group bacterium]